MHLTSFSNYAMRTLMFAGLRAPRLARVQEVADGYRISRTHVVKCVHNLGQWGFLENVRGRGGGFRLARPAHTITLGEVMRHTEDSFNLVECFVPETNTCPLMQHCRLSLTLKRATGAFLDVLDGVTLADLIGNRHEIGPVLGLSGHDTQAA